MGQEGGATGWLGEGLLQYEAHSPEVEVFGEAGGVSGARGEAVRGGAEGDHVTLRATWPARRQGLWGGARWAGKATNDRVDDMKTPLRERQTVRQTDSDGQSQCCVLSC